MRPAGCAIAEVPTVKIEEVRVGAADSVLVEATVVVVVEAWEGHEAHHAGPLPSCQDVAADCWTYENVAWNENARSCGYRDVAGTQNADHPADADHVGWPWTPFSFS